MQGPESSTSYNQELKPLNEEIKTERVVFPITYEEVQAIGNVLWDLHRELDKPEGERFLAYPQKEVEKLHDKIFKSMVNLSMSVETKYKSEH